jgi:hypothetical protein
MRLLAALTRWHVPAWVLLIATSITAVAQEAAPAGGDAAAVSSSQPAGAGQPQAATANSPAAPAGTTPPAPAATTEPAATTAPAAAATAPPSTAPAAAQLPLQERPYRVHVEVGFSGSGTALPAHRSEITRGIRDGFRRMYGSMWQAEVRESTWFLPGTQETLGRLQEALLIERYPESVAEKVLFVAVEGTDGGFEISCREFDSRIQELSPILSVTEPERLSVPNAACRLGRDCFRPILMFTNQTLDKSELEFVIQAGNLLPPDPSAAQLAEGDVLRTFLRQMDRKSPGKVKLLQRLDLCYVRITAFNQKLGTSGIPADELPVTAEGATAEPSVEFTDTARARGVLLSHGLVPFGGKGRNLQQIGLRQRPMATSSKVKLVLQNRPDRPLICLRVDQVQKLRQGDVSTVPARRVLTDRNGELELQVDPANPTFWLYAYSGSMLLARVPYAPGILPRETVKLPDDSIRLGVEGDMYLLRDELVDMVAEKAVYISLAKKASEARDLEKFQEMIATIDALPAKEAFSVRLNEIRAPAVDQATQAKNPQAKRKIESMVTKMGDSLNTFFSAEKRVKEADELQKLRDAAGLPPAAAPAPAPPAAPTATNPFQP